MDGGSEAVTARYGIVGDRLDAAVVLGDLDVVDTTSRADAILGEREFLLRLQKTLLDVGRRVLLKKGNSRPVRLLGAERSLPSASPGGSADLWRGLL